MNELNNNKIRLSIVIPVYNSEDTIDKLTDNLVQSLGEEYKLEIVLINDCSKDKSETICITSLS